MGVCGVARPAEPPSGRCRGGRAPVPRITLRSQQVPASQGSKGPSRKCHGRTASSGGPKWTPIEPLSSEMIMCDRCRLLHGDGTSIRGINWGCALPSGGALRRAGPLGQWALSGSLVASYIAAESQNDRPREVGVLQNKIVMTSHWFFINDFPLSLDPSQATWGLALLLETLGTVPALSGVCGGPSSTDI